jgi:hypothetical protein
MEWKQLRELAGNEGVDLGDNGNDGVDLSGNFGDFFSLSQYRVVAAAIRSVSLKKVEY